MSDVVEPEMRATEEAVQQVVGFLTGAALTGVIILGERLGLYRGLADSGPLTADALAESVATNPRLTREWLDANAAAGLVEYEERTDTYGLDAAHGAVLADRRSPVYLAAGAETLRAPYMSLERISDAFGADGAFAWADHHPCLFKGIAEFFRPGYEAFLVSEWIPALDRVDTKLRDGARVLDVGCGHGYSTLLLAEAYPASAILGIDYHPDSIAAANRHLQEVATANASFDVADAVGYDGEFDLICFFDCLHDLGDPVGAAAHTRAHLADGGTVMVVEPNALDSRADNHTYPMAPIGYAVSTFLCTPHSLSQPGQRALGNQGGEPAMRAVFEEAGFGHFRKAASNPVNAVYEARP